MTTPDPAPTLWAKLPVTLRAVISGLLMFIIAANVWPVFLVTLGVPLATAVEAIFLGLYLWWAAGGGRPRGTQFARLTAFRRRALSPVQWFWTLVAALFFASTVHASIVVLFRLVPFPTETFRRGYDISPIHSVALRWIAVVVSAASAAICEETGFRGYMQRPIEQRHGAPLAIFVSSLFFMLVHLTKAWATPGMVPIVFGAGVLLGLLAWSSQSLIPGMIGHFVMDVGLFAYWWTGLAGTFTARPISETGVDQSFFIACAALAASLLIVLLAISRLRRKPSSSS
ncbi:MAG: lysostaphin resistance A-like protein [Candidatus Acidiferrales bacterium]